MFAIGMISTSHVLEIFFIFLFFTVGLGSVYFAETEIFFAESTVDKSKI